MPPADNPISRQLGGQRNRAKSAALGLWDVTTGKPIRKFDALKSDVTAFAYAPDGRTIATANADGSVSLWETLTGKVRLEIKTEQEDGPIVRALIAALPDAMVPPKRTLAAMAFSPDSRVLAGAGADGAISLWDAVTGERIGKLAGHQGEITALTFTADSKTLLSGSGDTSALAWDVAAIIKACKTRSVAIEDGRAEAMWSGLSGGDAARAHQAVLRLVGAPGQAVPLLRAQLRPVPAPDADKIARLLDDLDSKEFAVRQKASDELEKLGDLAEHALKQALAAQPGLERRQRLEQLQERLVTAATLSAEQVQALRALEVLERIGTPEARDVLQRMAKGAAGARLTRQAQASLDRLRRQ